MAVDTDYDGYGRLIGYHRSRAGAQAYVYSGLDDRVTTIRPTGTRQFVYDADGRVRRVWLERDGREGRVHLGVA